MSHVRQKRSVEPVSQLADIRLITLGCCGIRSGGEPLPGGLATGRPLGLLVYLVMHSSRWMSRDVLADLLWRDRDIKSARRVLRQALYVIRKGLGDDVLAIEGDRVRYTGAIPVDVRDFEAAVAGGDAEAAFDLYQGPFLEGFSVASGGAFGIWADGERYRIAQKFRQVALDLAQSRCATGDWVRALECVDAAASASPGDLVLRMRRVEILELAGRRLEALSEAHVLLAETPELSDEQRELLERVGLETSPAIQTEADESGPALPAFHGRETELDALFSLWHRVLGQEGKIALVVGDPGIGKSRLIGELLRVAELEGATVLAGKSYELEDGLLFGALVDVMAQAIPSPGFAAVSDIWLSELTRLLPELVELYPRLDIGGDVSTGPGRRRFHEAVAQIFEALAYEAPVVCVLDDLHWADDATLELVHYLVRRLCASPVLILAGLRPREASDALRRLQHTLEDEHGGLRITLAPLDRPAAAAVTRSIGHGHVPPPAVEQLIWDAAGGVPFLTVATLGAMFEAGTVAIGKDGWEVAGDRGGGALPDAWLLIRDRLADLPSHTLEVLRLAAVAGRSFDAGLLSDAAGDDPGRASVHLDALARRRILKVDRRDGKTTFDFTHDRLRRIVYEGIPEQDRPALHLKAARALASSAGLNSCILARHLDHAGQCEDAYRYALAGAEWARGVFAHAGELEMLELASKNAPSDAERVLIDERVDDLDRTPARPGQSHLAPKSLSRRRWTLGAAATGLIALAGWAASSVAGRSPILLDALPEGVLVWVEAGDSSAFAVVDPDQPRRDLKLLSAAVLSVPTQTNIGSLQFSRDLKQAAFTLDDGGAPDVWIQNADGSGLRALTHDPGDDVPLDWLPDGSGVVTRTLREGGRADYRQRLILVQTDGSDYRDITNGGWRDRSAAISPDGGRLAVSRSLDTHSIWIMDLDGANAASLLEDLDEPGILRWSPDGQRLAFFETRGSVTYLRTLKLSDPKGTLRTLVAGAEGSFAWAPDGSKIFFSQTVAGNSEVFSVGVDSGESTRLTFSQASEIVVGYSGERDVHAESVQILGVGSRGLLLLEGDSQTVTAVAWAGDGTLISDTISDVTCLDPSVCTVTPDQRVTGVSEGVTHLVAALGGWRADTVVVRVSSAKPITLLEESWEGGLNPQLWNSVGDPQPEVRLGLGRDGSKGFVAGGDRNLSSGVVSVMGYDWTGGLTVEAWGTGEFEPPEWPSFQAFGLGLNFESHPPSASDSPLGLGPRITIGRDQPLMPATLTFGGPVIDSSGWDSGEWHLYALQVRPTGVCEAWVDGELWARRVCSRPPSDSVWVVLDGRSTHEPVVHDDVRISRGLRWR